MPVTMFTAPVSCKPFSIYRAETSLLPGLFALPLGGSHETVTSRMLMKVRQNRTDAMR